MKLFFVTLPAHLAGCFRGWNWAWHLLAMGLTAILVLSGFDWHYYQATGNPLLRRCMFPAALIGFFVPLFLPPFLSIVGRFVRKPVFALAAWAVAQAEVIAWLVSSTYKAFTGRAHPLRHSTDDLTRVFHFGFLRGGVFWGWPSSHTTVAFALAFTLVRLFPKQRVPHIIAIAYAGYIGVGVSITIHWFTDFLAGAIIGTLIGVVVGNGFRSRLGA